MSSNIDYKYDKTVLLNTTPSTSSDTGAFQSLGGISISNTSDAVSATNGGTFTTAGGLAVAKKLYVGDTLVVDNELNTGTIRDNAGNLQIQGTDGTTGIVLNSTGTVSIPTSLQFGTTTYTSGKINIQDSAVGGAIRLLPTTSGLQSSIAFLRNADGGVLSSGDHWLLGQNILGVGDRSFGIGIANASPSFLITSTGTAGFPNGFTVNGTTSGKVSVLPQAAAGTYNFNLPTTAGTAGQSLMSGGGGSEPMTWGSAGGGAALYSRYPSSNQNCPSGSTITVNFDGAGTGAGESRFSHSNGTFTNTSGKQLYVIINLMIYLLSLTINASANKIVSIYSGGRSYGYTRSSNPNATPSGDYAMLTAATILLPVSGTFNVNVTSYSGLLNVYGNIDSTRIEVLSFPV